MKQGTINDHFIEWALMDENFPFEGFQLLDFSHLSIEQVIDQHYQGYDVPYLSFRLSQIYHLRKFTWN